MKFKSYINEALITLANKRPKYNNIVILAGGAGSGKGFINTNLLGIEGKTFDVDEIKRLGLKIGDLVDQDMAEYFIEVLKVLVSKKL
jgi:hypothetical protein